MAYEVEVTDTFGGEANYCWVKRYQIPEGTKRKQLVRKAKALANWQGLRCSTWDCGDYIEVRPIGKRAPCWIMFITWTEDTL